MSLNSTTAITPVYNFTTQDKLRIGEIDYLFLERDKRVVLLARADNPKIVERFTHAELAVFTEEQSFRYSRRHYAEDVVALTEANDGDILLSDLSESEKQRINWREAWVLAVLALEREGGCTRSDTSLEQGMKTILHRLIDADLTFESDFARQLLTIRKPPCTKKIREWMKIYDQSGGRAMALRWKKRKCGSRQPRIHERVHFLMVEHADSYCDEGRPTKENCFLNLKNAIKKENEKRAVEGLIPLESPSKRRFFEEINKLPAYDQMAARRGIDAAERAFGFGGEGFNISRIGERIEMDEVNVPLISFLQWTHLDRFLKPGAREKIKARRIWIGGAIDVASRCIVGLCFSITPTAEAAVSVVDEITADKTALALAFGVQSAVPNGISFELVGVDQGSAYMSGICRQAISDVISTNKKPSAGYAKGRPFIERWFRTLSTGLLGYFTGRTFENVVAKGDYDPGARRSLHID
jgi:putative transposase